MPTEEVSHSDNAHNEEVVNPVIGFIKETIQTVLIALALTAFIYYFIATPNQVQGVSMYPTIHPNELILTNRVKHLTGNTGLGENLDWDYKRGQIIIFQQEGKDAFIKRIVAVPGDEIIIKENELVVNGEVVLENYLDDDVITTPGTFIGSKNIIVVPKNQYIVFGDNRTNSLDSRDISVGFIDRRDIIGPAELRIFPVNKLGLLDVGDFNTIPYDDYESEENTETDLKDVIGE